MLWSPAIPLSANPSSSLPAPLDLDSIDMVDPKLDAITLDIDVDIVDPLSSFVTENTQSQINKIDIPSPSPPIDTFFPIGPINDLTDFNDFNDLNDFNDINNSSTQTTPPPSTTSSSSSSSTSIDTFDNNTIEPNILYLSDYDQSYKANLITRPSFSIALENPTIHIDDTIASSSNILTNSPVLKSQSQSQSQSQSHDDTHYSSDIDDDFVRINNKKLCDSRLSLTQLSLVLNLEGNDAETALREKNILHILRNDLGFPIGEKTWIRDTPPSERERILAELTQLVESTYHYGYSKKILAIIVRRASYYMMQGRLRRQRRLNRKKSLQAKQQQQQQQQHLSTD